MNKRNQPSLEEHLPVLKEMQAIDTDAFFYTRLKARMENESQRNSWQLPVSPAWVAGTLLIFLAANCYMLVEKNQTQEQSSSNVEHFAKSYDQLTYSY